MARIVVLEFEEDAVKVRYGGESSAEVEETRKLFSDWLGSLHEPRKQARGSVVAFGWINRLRSRCRLAPASR